ncbi:MAG: tetratricopeptide repeat protein [Chloroflexi bacterium]|nr:tetratricopeptide repeat protein [Chloroflexota bacterium]
MTTEALLPLVTSILGIVIGALLNHFLSRRKYEAEIEKLKAEAEQVKTETEKNRLEIEKRVKAVPVGQTEPLPELGTAEEYYARGKRLSIMGNHGQAIDDFSRAIQLDPRNAAYYVARGQSYFDMGAWSECAEDETKAIELEPKNARFYALRGNTYRMAKIYNLAIADFSKGIELDPQRDDCYYGRAHCLYEEWKGDFERDIDKAIEISPRGEYLFLRGKINFEHGRVENRYLKWQKAEEKFREAIDDFSHSLASMDTNLVYWWMGRCYYELNQYEQAIANFSNAIFAQSDDGSSYYWRGMCYKAQSQFSLKNKWNARKDFQKAAQLGNGQAQNEL